MKNSFMLLGALILAANAALPLRGGAQTTLARRGAELDGTLVQALSSKTNHPGDLFSLGVKESRAHRIPALRGGTIEGHVENVSAAGPGHRARLTISFDDVKMPDGTLVPIQAKVLSLRTFAPHGHRLRDAGIVLGSALTGHVVAARTGLAHGALIGAVAGLTLASKMSGDVVVRAGTVVRLRLLNDIASGDANTPHAPPAKKL